jgi:hypothetical protein
MAFEAKFQVARLIESPTQIAEHYETIHKAIGGTTNSNDDQLWLVKQEGWVAVVAYGGCFYAATDEARLVQTLLDYGYQEFIATAWSEVLNTPPVLALPTTVEALEELRLTIFCWWYVLFAGEPDWFILLAHTLDFIIVAGPPNFVQQVLGCDPDEAAGDIQEMAESEYLNPVARKYYAHLLEQLWVVYPQAQPGEIIDLGLLQWNEEGENWRCPDFPEE